VHDQPEVWDALDLIRGLQDAVVAHDRDLLDAWVSDRMLWVMPLPDNARGKHEWIEASCSVAWDWFDIRVSREVDLGDTRLVEAWISQQYKLPSEDGSGQAKTVAGQGVVVDLWALEEGTWRLVARHPQKAQA